MSDSGGSRYGCEEQQTGGHGRAEHLIGDDERNITIIVEERRGDLVRGEGRAQTVVERECQQQ